MAYDRYSDFAAAADYSHELLPDTALLGGRFRIRSFLNSGGFGITYVAEDSTGRDVVLKECFVPAFCRRNGTLVAAQTQESAVHLQKAIRSFLAEAEALATLSHPNIVRVHQTFRDNDTAYMVLDHIPGHDLLDIIEDNPAALTPRRIAGLTVRLVRALSHIHHRQLVHCDISPDNIRLRPDGDPVLIDFGSARRTVATGPRHTGFSMVKDGYSPHELYSPAGLAGPWSDIYALGASLYHAVTGAAPADCQSRLTALVDGRPDPVPPLAGLVTGYPPGVLESIDKAMAVRVAQRHASARDWLAQLEPRVPAALVALIRRAPVAAAQVSPVPQTW